MDYFAKDAAVLIDGKYQATVLADYGKKTVLIKYGNDCYWMQRSRLALPANYLAQGEQPTPANVHYYGGIMQERSERRR